MVSIWFTKLYNEIWYLDIYRFLCRFKTITKRFDNECLDSNEYISFLETVILKKDDDDQEIEYMERGMDLSYFYKYLLSKLDKIN